MRFMKERIFDYPAQALCDLFLDSEETAYDMAELENVTQWKVVKEEEKDGIRYGTKEWCAHAQIPKTLQHIVSPKMLTWYEHSQWNREKKRYSFEIEPFYMKKKVKCKGQTTYKGNGEGKTLRIFKIELKVDIPVAGRIFENLVMGLLEKNEEDDFHQCVKACKKAFG